MTNHLVAVAGLFVNNHWYEALDADVQAAFEAAAEKSEAWAREAWHAENDSVVAELQGLMEVTELDDAALSEFQEAAKSSWAEAAEFIGPEYLDKVLGAAGLSLD